MNLSKILLNKVAEKVSILDALLTLEHLDRNHLSGSEATRSLEQLKLTAEIKSLLKDINTANEKP